MPGRKTPDWLIETQNKSWEPEILISGITLTFLFLLTDNIYNFFGMLVQEFAVFETIARNSFRISIILLTGFKIILIVHLILRGIWTGLVGLSYVYPAGVKKQNLPDSGAGRNFLKPANYVIKIEKVCSLLFSFIFSSLTFVIGFFLFFAPIILLFITGLHITWIRNIIVFILIPLVLLIFLLSLIFSRKLKNSPLSQRFNDSILNHTFLIYVSNIGMFKTSLIFLSYFVIIFIISLNDLSRFDFENRNSAEIPVAAGVPYINADHYSETRNQNLRIPKATLDVFRTADSYLKLFVSFFKEDIYTIEEFHKNPVAFRQLGIDSGLTRIDIKDLYRIYVDEQPILKPQWYFTENSFTGQKGLITHIAADSLKPGYHRLRIEKLYWGVRKNEVRLIQPWAILPFVTYVKTKHPE